METTPPKVTFRDLTSRQVHHRCSATREEKPTDLRYCKASSLSPVGSSPTVVTSPWSSCGLFGRAAGGGQRILTCNNRYSFSFHADSPRTASTRAANRQGPFLVGTYQQGPPWRGPIGCLRSPARRLRPSGFNRRAKASQRLLCLQTAAGSAAGSALPVIFRFRLSILALPPPLRTATSLWHVSAKNSAPFSRVQKRRPPRRVRESPAAQCQPRRSVKRHPDIQNLSGIKPSADRYCQQSSAKTYRRKGRVSSLAGLPSLPGPPRSGR